MLKLANIGKQNAKYEAYAKIKREKAAKLIAQAEAAESKIVKEDK